MLDDSARYGERFLSGVIHLLVTEAPPSERGKRPNIPRHPTLGIGFPHFAVLDDFVFQAFLTFVGLSDWREDIAVGFGEPQQWLIGGSERPLAVPCKPVLVVPDDLATIEKPHIEHHALNPTHMVMDAVDEDVAFVGEQAVGLLKPQPRPVPPFGLALGFLPRSKILVQIVGRVCNDQVEGTGTEGSHALDAIAVNYARV